MFTVSQTPHSFIPPPSSTPTSKPPTMADESKRCLVGDGMGPDIEARHARTTLKETKGELARFLAAQILEKSVRDERRDQLDRIEAGKARTTFFGLGDDKASAQLERIENQKVVRKIQEQQTAGREQERLHSKSNTSIEREEADAASHTWLKSLEAEKLSASKRKIELIQSIASQKAHIERAQEDALRMSADEEEKIHQYRKLISEREHSVSAAQRNNQAGKDAIALVLSKGIQKKANRENYVQVLREEIRSRENELKLRNAEQEKALSLQQAKTGLAAAYRDHLKFFGNMKRSQDEERVQTRIQAQQTYVNHLEEEKAKKIAQKHLQRCFKEELDKAVDYKLRMSSI